MTTTADEARRRVEAICAALPGATAEGRPHLACTVRRRTFAWLLDDHHGDGRLALNVKVEPGRNTAMAADEPERFFLPDYLAARGWVGVALDRGAVDWDLVAELLTGGYRLVAPRSLIRELDARAP